MFYHKSQLNLSDLKIAAKSLTVVGRAKNILKYLCDIENVQFLHFLCDVQQPLKYLSLAFQANQLTPGTFYNNNTTMTYVLLCQLKMLLHMVPSRHRANVGVYCQERHCNITRRVAQHSWSCPYNQERHSVQLSTAWRYHQGEGDHDIDGYCKQR